jgi:predicted aspartyl protease
MNLRAVYCVSMAFALGGSAEAMAASNCQLTQIADWPVKLVGNHLVVDGAINGRKIGVMLDTGGTSMILRSAADRLGLTRHQAPQYRLFGVGGESYVEAAIVDEFRVGNLARKNWEVMVAGEHDLGPSIDVVLGEDVFDHVDVEFDLMHGRVRLFQPRGCEGVALGYWAPQGTSQVNLASGPRIVVPVGINAHPIQAELDSGASSSVLDKPAAGRLGIGPETPGATLAGKGGGLGAKSVEYWIVPLQSFTLGDESNQRYSDPRRRSVQRRDLRVALREQNPAEA